MTAMPLLSLDPDEADSIAELFNIGMGQSAAALGDMIGEEVHLSVPSLSVSSRSRIAHQIAHEFDADAAARARLAVEQQQVDLVVVDQPDAGGVLVGLDELDLDAGRRAGAHGQPHPVADLRVVAVEQDGAKTIAHRDVAPTS